MQGHSRLLAFKLLSHQLGKAVFDDAGVQELIQGRQDFREALLGHLVDGQARDLMALFVDLLAPCLSHCQLKAGQHLWISQIDHSTSREPGFSGQLAGLRIVRPGHHQATAAQDNVLKENRHVSRFFAWASSLEFDGTNRALERLKGT